MDFESEPNAETTAEILEPHSMDDQGINNDPGGFGFITFADPSSVDKVLAQPVHELDRKKIDPKVAFPKKTQPKMVTKTKKIFIGGLSATSSVDDMKNYFSQFGKIEEAMLMFDKSTNRHRANYAAAACMPRVGYSPGTIVYPAPNYYGLMLAPGDKVYPADFAALSSPPATLTLGTRPDWSRSIFNGIQTAAGYISAPTSPTGPIQPRGFPATPSAVGPQPFDFYTAAPAADFSSLLATSPQNLPQFQLKTPQLIAAYSGYH